MWIFTKVADWFDQTRQDNDKWIDSELQPWVASTLYEDSPWYRNAAVYAGAGVLYSVNKLTTTVASGFVDVLRLGDGAAEGGWGWGKDALRLLMILGPAARGLRWAAALVPAVDETKTMGNCGWIAATRLARWTSIKPLSTLGDLVKAAGLSSVTETGGLKAVDELAQPLENLGVRTRIVGNVKSMQDVAELAAKNPNSAVMFGVRWVKPSGQQAGHVLYAVRNVFGGLTIVDRSGAYASSLAELEMGAKYLAGIGQGLVADTAVVADNSAVITALGTLPTAANLVSTAAKDLGGVRPSTQPTTSASQPKAAGASAASSGAGGPRPPAGVTPGVLTVESDTTFWQQGERGIVPHESVRKTYKVGKGEGLSLIAQRVYGDASKWPIIASVNGIKPPKYLIHEGQNLIIP